MHNKSFHSALKKAKNLGSAHEGVHHWWHQRLTAIMLVLLTSWLFCFLARLIVEGGNLVLLLREPYNLVGALLFAMVAFYHGALGMRVVIEDYVSNLCWRYKLIITVQIISFFTVATAFIALVFFITKNI